MDRAALQLVPDQTTRVCRYCKAEKPLDDFYRQRPEHPERRMWRCKACYGAMQKAYRTRHPGHEPISGVLLRCFTCKEEKPAEQFGKNRRLQNGRKNSCPQCLRESGRETNWQRAGIDITREKYSELLAKQRGGCAICGGQQASKNKRHFDVDHDHATGRVRGLLCHGCNLGLGAFKDDAARLTLASLYLERNRG